MSIINQIRNQLNYKFNIEGESILPELSDVEIAETFKYAQENNLVGDLTLADFYQNPDLALQIINIKAEIELYANRLRLGANYQIQEMREALTIFESKVKKLIDKE